MLVKKFIIILSLFLAVSAFAAEKEIIMGGKQGWPELARTNNVSEGVGKFGYQAMMLSTNSKPLDSNTDLYLSFEGKEVSDKTGNYSVTKNTSLFSKKSIMGRSAASFRGNDVIRLRGGASSLFGTQGITGSFTIEFWMNPSIAENGEVVFSWRSSRTVSNYPLYQMISASFFSNHLQWNFTNVFNGYVDNEGEISLESYRTIIPDCWMHHLISFNADTGLLEYRINGELESLKYITTNYHETGGSVYSSFLGVPADIEICPQFTGFIDDFRISRGSRNSEGILMRYDNFDVQGGRFETKPILLSKGASIRRIDAIVSQPSQTDVEFYVRSGDNYYNWTDTEPQWIPVKNHEPISDTKGLYFQVAAELFPDGSGKKTPSVTELRIVYEDVPSPMPPFSLFAQAEDEAVTLSWEYSVDNSVGGYYIFYGERPGEYLGQEAVEGVSPVYAGSVTSAKLSGLKNGKIYYFAVASYSKYDQRIMGELSTEVFARPMKR